MCNEELLKQLKTYEKNYIEFMEIDSFPKYELKTKEISYTVADHQGFDTVASASYEPQYQHHTLVVSTNIALSEPVAFHEFTHILDSEALANSDRARYAGLSGYTEYHASQVELMRMLGATTVKAKPTFSIDSTSYSDLEHTSIREYINKKHLHAIELFSRNDFPANFQSLTSSIGILFNYFGLRSICEMYSTNYKEVICNEAFLQYIPTISFCRINNLMHGWLNENDIELSMQMYTGLIMSLIKNLR